MKTIFEYCVCVGGGGGGWVDPFKGIVLRDVFFLNILLSYLTTTHSTVRIKTFSLPSENSYIIAQKPLSPLTYSHIKPPGCYVVQVDLALNSLSPWPGNPEDQRQFSSDYPTNRNPNPELELRLCCNKNENLLSLLWALGRGGGAIICNANGRKALVLEVKYSLVQSSIQYVNLRF